MPESFTKLKRFDFGVGLGAGAEFGKIGVGLGYDFGLANISDESGFSIKTQNAYLTLGYKF
ncbi:MAG: PorT family protein [Prevotella sp.]|nr:PorT family protein [Prevotella sp.]